jgi:hypothetical protein
LKVAFVVWFIFVFNSFNALFLDFSAPEKSGLKQTEGDGVKKYKKWESV